jgi:hypothetical protein
MEYGNETGVEKRKPFFSDSARTPSSTTAFTTGSPPGYDSKASEAGAISGVPPATECALYQACAGSRTLKTPPGLLDLNFVEVVGIRGH